MYETLFYYACLETQTIFLDAEILEITGTHFNDSSPWFEAIPLYDIIPNLHQLREGNTRIRRVPQIKADFLVFYVDDEGPSPFALVDVKSRKPRKYQEEWSWQVIAAMRGGFIFQLAFPKSEKEYPKSLRDWELKVPCSECKGLSDDYRKCGKCGAEIFPFTGADAYYEAKKLWEFMGKIREGRF